MVNFVAILLTFFVGAALGQSVSSASSFSGSTSASSTSTPAATHTVSVGAEGYTFTPSETVANVGDIIQFRFYPQNHSVARAAFGQQPCIPYEDTGAGRVGFWSGFLPVSVVNNNPPIFSLRINDTEPVFFYCSAPSACFNGMVGVINANSTFTFAQQLAYTTNATLEFSPLEYFPVEASATRTTSRASATPSATASTAAVTTPSSKSSGLPTGAIVGIALGGIAAAVFAAVLIYMCGRQKTVKELLRQSTHAPTNHNSYQPASPGLSEANYPNMLKSPNFDASGGAFAANNTQNGYYASGRSEAESYRSMSPPVDERTVMMGMHPVQFAQGQVSPGLMSPGSSGLQSPTYLYGGGTHEMQDGNSAGLRLYADNPNPSPDPSGPHEMPVPSRNPSMTTHPAGDTNRPFSFTNSESGYTPARHPDTDEKI